jgi:hypothetical protein
LYGSDWYEAAIFKNSNISLDFNIVEACREMSILSTLSAGRLISGLKALMNEFAWLESCFDTFLAFSDEEKSKLYNHKVTH